MACEKRVYAVRDNEGKLISVLEVCLPAGAPRTGPATVTPGGQVVPGPSVQEFTEAKKAELMAELEKTKL